MTSSGFSDNEYDNLVREGITAARGGKKALARRLLERAAGQNPTDSRVWLWLSATTEDAFEQRDFLEKAIAADPTNTAAKKGLGILAEKLGEPVLDLPQQSLKDGYVKPDEKLFDPQRTLQGKTHAFDCPNCGGGMFYTVDAGLECEYCGFTSDSYDDLNINEAEMALSPVLQTSQAHVWAVSGHDIVCEKCGAHTLAQPGIKTTFCPYCGSNHLVESEQLTELIEPQLIGLFEVNLGVALQKVRSWLREGIFSPDNLEDSAKKLELRPAYYPFWTFDGGVEVHWSAEIRDTYGEAGLDKPEWRPVSGKDVEFFDDILIPGVSALRQQDLYRILPFKLKELIQFEPAHIAGWTAMAYDRSIADASLRAREIVMRRVGRKIGSTIEPGREKRNVSAGAGNWSGLTYKHILLPIWMGTYEYGGDTFKVIVNGQTGKASGTKPKDNFKIVGIWVLGILGAIMVIVMLVLILSNLGVF